MGRFWGFFKLKKIIKDIIKVKGAIGEERVLQNQYCDLSSKFFQTFKNL